MDEDIIALVQFLSIEKHIKYFFQYFLRILLFLSLTFHLIFSQTFHLFFDFLHSLIQILSQTLDIILFSRLVYFVVHIVILVFSDYSVDFEIKLKLIIGVFWVQLQLGVFKKIPYERVIFALFQNQVQQIYIE